MGVGLDADAFEREYLLRPALRPQVSFEVAEEQARQLGDPPRIIRLPGGEFHLGEIRAVLIIDRGNRVAVTYEWVGMEIVGYGARVPNHAEPPPTPEAVRIIQEAWVQESHRNQTYVSFSDWFRWPDQGPPVHPRMRSGIVGRGWDFAIIDDPVRDSEARPDIARLVQRHMEAITAATHTNTNEAPAGEPLTLDSLLRTMEAYRFPGPVEPKTDPARKARAILLRFLTAEQRETFTGSGVFACRGRETNAEYLVQSVRQINIVDFTKKRRLCYVIPEVPLDDQLLAQKLLIEGDEQHLLDVARVWPF